MLQWNPVPGAVSYDVAMTTPGNGSINANSMDTTAYTPTNLSGTGNFTWKVRAEFPTGSGNIYSAWSTVKSFSRAIGAPQSATATVGGSHSVVASWVPKANARQYQVEFGSNSSFSAVNDEFTTDNTTVAPLLTNDLYVQGGTIYWRVQSQDQDGNWSAWSQVKTLTMPMLLSVTISGGATKGATSTLKITVKTGFYPGKAVSGVTIKKSGCGLTASSAKTGSAGAVSFKVKPPKGNCNITFAASKTGAIAAKATAHIY